MRRKRGGIEYRLEVDLRTAGDENSDTERVMECGHQ